MRRSAPWALAVAIALALALLPGCSEQRPTLLVWHSYRGDSESALIALAREYEASRGVRVELLGVPFEAFSAKLEAAVPRGHGPDVFIDAHERLGSYLKNSIVAPSGDAFPDDDVSRFDAATVAAVTAGSARYAVPLEAKCLALFVNDALVAGAPETLEALLATPVAAGSYPLAYEAQSAYFQAPFLSAFGGRMLGDGDAFGFVGDEAARSLAFTVDLSKRHLIPDEPTDALVSQLFSQGKAAAVISGPWLAAELKGPARWHVVALPKLGATGLRMRPLLTVDGAFVTPEGVKKADARAFARFLGTTEASVVRATVGHQIVADRAAWLNPEVARNATLSAFHEAAAFAVPMPASPRMRAVWVPAEQAIRKAMRGDATADEALREARARFDDALTPPPPPPSPAPLVLAAGVLLMLGATLLVRRARSPEFQRDLRASWPAYKYVAHAALTVVVLVVLPLLAGAVTSLFAGTQGDPRYVGLANYTQILTARGGPLLGHGSFYLTLLVTVLWTAANVTLHLAFGMVLGVVLSRPLLKLKALYRVVLILPWAVPSYVTALAWKGMFHRQFGAINAILVALGCEPVSWFSKFSTALAANVTTNVWLGFPFMMVVVMGALTGISKDVLEAADVDGASRWQRFRLVTLPLLKPALLPSVVLGSVWTFNMFNVVFLVSGGEPDGGTDILVSEAYRWAFTRDAQYGYAAAYAVLIFLLLAGGTRALSRLTEAEA